MTHENIVSLANLVKISVSETESLELIPKMDSILDYIDQIQNVNLDDLSETYTGENPILRADIEHTTKDFSFMDNVPLSENGYVKVPRVLNID